MFKEEKSEIEMSKELIELNSIEIIKNIEQEFTSTIVFTDNSGIKNVQFISDIKPLDILNSYYDWLWATYHQ